MVLVTSTNSLYTLPAMLKNLKYCFIVINMLSAKQCNYYLTYSLKVSPLRLPIFLYISIAVSCQRQCIIFSRTQRMSVYYVYCNTFQRRTIQCDGCKFQRCTHVLSSEIFFLLPNHYADKYVFILLKILWIDTHHLSNALTGKKFSSTLCS